MPRQPSCTCDACPKCKNRQRAREMYKALSPEERRALVDRRDKDKERAKDRRRYERDKSKRLDAQARYRNTERGRERSNKAKREWAARNRHKRKAQRAVNNAIRDGRLQRGTACELADSTCQGRLEAHHDDYSKPLAVRWLCDRHHKAEHAKMKS